MAVDMTEPNKMKAAGAAIKSLLQNPAFGTFVLVLWGYTILMEFVLVISQPDWGNVALWIAFVQNSVKQTALLFFAILGKVMRMSYQNENEQTKQEMKVISNATLSLINKALMSDDTKLREHAMNLSTNLIGMGVSLYDAAFHDSDGELARKIADELDMEKKK